MGKRLLDRFFCHKDIRMKARKCQNLKIQSSVDSGSTSDIVIDYESSWRSLENNFNYVFPNKNRALFHSEMPYYVEMQW